MHHSARSVRLGWYLVAGTVAVAGLLFRWLLDPILGDSAPFSISIILGVILSRYSGFMPGVVAVLSGLVASRYLFVEPRGAFAFADMADLVSMSIPASGGLLIAWLMGQLKISQERAERQSQALLEKQHAYEQELIERRRVESHLLATKADLRLGQEEFRTLAEKSPVGIFRTDQTGACTFVNEYWCRLAGISAEETMGTGWARVIHPDDLQEFVRRWQESLRAERPFVGGYRICRPDGEICTAITAAQPVLDDQGRLAHYVGMVLDMTEQKDAFDALARKQALLRSLIEAQEREKSLLCHEFHDGLIQYAVASLMMLESCRHGGREPLSPEVSDAIDNVTRFLSVGIEDGRRVIRGIRTAVLDDLGLEAAIDDLVDQFQTGGIACETSIDLGADALPASLQTTIYRIVQESLSNVRRHSGATKARVRVTRIDDGVQVSIHDDGCGFDRTGVRPRGFGLIGIEERTMLAGGECRIESTPGRGTTVSVQLPVPHDTAESDPALEPAASG